MIRLLIAALLAVAGNAVGLVVAAAVLDDMALDASGFLIAVLLFTGVEVIIQPLIIKIGMKHARALVGSSALVASFVALVVTTIVSDGLRIEGALTWVMATVIVWAGALLAGLILPALFLKQAAGTRRGQQGAQAPAVRTWP